MESNGAPQLTPDDDEELPIPVPDVPGADATVRGLPRRTDLTRRQRLIVDTSAIADLALRTSIASLIGATMVPAVMAPAPPAMRYPATR